MSLPKVRREVPGEIVDAPALSTEARVHSVEGDAMSKWSLRDVLLFPFIAILVLGALGLASILAVLENAAEDTRRRFGR